MKLVDGKQQRLQRELSQRLMLPLLAIVVLTALLGAWGAQQHVERVFDRWLLDAARSLAAQVRIDAGGRASVELSPQAEALLTYDIVDRTYFEVMQGDRPLLGQPGIPRHGERERAVGPGGRAFDALFRGQEVRVACVAMQVGGGGPEVTVIVAETLIKRSRARAELLLTLAPAAALVLAAAFVIGLAVRRTLGTLERIAARWNARSHASLDPLPMDEVPKELLPFAAALNDLLQRVRQTVDRERHFAATVAHQLRTPLTGLRLGIARAAEATQDGSTRQLLTELGESTQRTARLVQQLLSLSRLEPEAQVGLHRADVDVVALAQDVGETYQDAAMARNLVLELIANSGGLVVRGDPVLLGEALGNLVDNAVRYATAGGRILITVDAESASIEVADSGPGIPAGERGAVFQRFVRGASAAAQGSGLGLAIVEEIAELHRARVTLGPSALGGARFVVSFAR